MEMDPGCGALAPAAAPSVTIDPSSPFHIDFSTSPPPARSDDSVHGVGAFAAMFGSGSPAAPTAHAPANSNGPANVATGWQPGFDPDALRQHLQDQRLLAVADALDSMSMRQPHVRTGHVMPPSLASGS